MLTAKQIRKLAKAKTDRELTKPTSFRKACAGAGLWHDTGGTIIFAEVPDQNLVAKNLFDEIKATRVDLFQQIDARTNVELFATEIAGIFDKEYRSAATFVRFVSADGQVQEWANAGYVVALIKRGATQFFASEKHEIAARNGRTIAIFMPMNFSEKRPEFDWSLRNEDLLSG